MVKFDAKQAAEFEIKKDEWAAEKQHRYEERVIKQILSYISADGKTSVKNLVREQGGELTWDWFNEMTAWECRFSSARELSYNFEALLLGKQNHPLVKDWVNAWDGDHSKDCALAFRCARFAGADDPKQLVITSWWPFPAATSFPYIGGIPSGEAEINLHVTLLKEYILALQAQEWI